MINPWLLLGVALAWIASLAAVGVWQHNAGATGERVAWQQREITQQAEYAAAVKRVTDAARAKEQAAAVRIASISANYQGRIKDAAAQRDSDLADARAGALKLRINTACESPAGSGAGQTGAGTGGRDGGAGTELPATVTASLFALADDADALVDQLASCQAVIAGDRQ